MGKWKSRIQFEDLKLNVGKLSKKHWKPDL